MLQHLFQVEPIVFFAHGDLLSKPFNAFVDHLGVFKVLNSRSIFPVWALSIDFVELHSAGFFGQLSVVESQWTMTPDTRIIVPLRDLSPPGAKLASVAILTPCVESGKATMCIDRA